MNSPLFFARQRALRFALAAAALFVAPALFAYEGRLLPDDVLVSREPGRESATMSVSLLVRPGARDAVAFTPPEKLHLRVTSGDIIAEVDFILQPQEKETGLGGNGFSTMDVAVEDVRAKLEHRYRGTLPTSARGPTLLEIVDGGAFTAIRTLVSVLPAREESKANLPPAERPAMPLAETVAKQVTKKPIVPEIQPNEPVYFTMGGFRGGLHRLDARFQLSLKYRFTAQNDDIGNLGAAITTTSLWDLHSYSVPFRDTTYRPSILWMLPTRKSEDHAKFSWSADIGIFEHESNGRGPDPDQPLSSANNDSLSRSMNRSYLRPTLTWTDEKLGIFSVSPKIFVPYLVSKGNNDIAQYRGYADLLLKWMSRQDRGHVVSLLMREGTHSGRHFVEADYGLPLRVFSKDANGWVLFQWLYGYGETLRDYRVRNPGTLRVGLMIVP